MLRRQLMTVRMLALVALSGVLCSCVIPGLLGARKRRAGSSQSDTDTDSPDRRARAALDEMEKKLVEGDADANAGWHSSLVYSFLYGPRPLEMSDRTAIEQRWKALTARMIQEAGPAGATLYGDGRRTDKAHPEALEVLNDGLKECFTVRRYKTPGGELDERYEKYRAQLARAQRLDPNVISYYAEKGDSMPEIIDNRMKLVQCEYLVASKRMEFADWHVLDTGTKVTSVGCGVAVLRVAQKHLGAGRFAEYQFFGWWIPFEKIACSDIPPSSKFKKLYADAVARAGDMAGKIVVERGAPFTDSSPEEGTWRIQELLVYSRNAKFGGTDCPKNVICEYGPESAAQVYLQKFETARHISARADVHRKAGHVERCRKLLKDAYARYEEATELRKDHWGPAKTFKVAGEPRPVPEATVVARFKELSELADTRRVGAYCTEH
jgi:hypothetical protein